LWKHKSYNISSWVSNSKDPTTYAYATIEILSFLSLWEGKKSPYVPLQWFEGGEYAKMDVVSTPCK